MTLERRTRLLHNLKRLNRNRLWRLHRKVFRESRFRISLPYWTSKAQLIEQIYHLYCYQHPLTNDPLELRLHIDKLKAPVLKTVDEYRAALRNYKQLTEAQIQDLPLATINGLLAALGIFIPRAFERQVLLEHYHSRLRLQYRRRHSVLKAVKRKLKKHLSLSYVEFYEKFNGVVPRVSPEQFRRAKVQLRKAGYDVPRLRPGRRKATVRVDETDAGTPDRG